MCGCGHSKKIHLRPNQPSPTLANPTKAARADWKVPLLTHNRNHNHNTRGQNHPPPFPISHTFFSLLTTKHPCCLLRRQYPSSATTAVPRCPAATPLFSPPRVTQTLQSVSLGSGSPLFASPTHVLPPSHAAQKTKEQPPLSSRHESLPLFNLHRNQDDPRHFV